jgi:iron complex outermembrane receptor protein
MKRLILLLSAVFSISTGFSQNTFKAFIKDSSTEESLAGATVVLNGTSNGSISDTSGLLELSDIPDGKQILVFSYVGYKQRVDTLIFPLRSSETKIIFMESAAEEIEEIVISSTRSTRTIGNMPTRAEFIAGEELEEKGNMKPGDIRMMLNESTGIQTQQTSATSYNSSIRIQGLDGKYTQILKDGMPLYSGFSGGLSLLQIVPLDLKQVEVIKGAASTLYGGGAIAGLVNLISKTPTDESEMSFLLNGTSALGLDASGFYSQRFDKIGTTIFASYNQGTPYDPSDVGFTAIPDFKRITINPKLFLYLSGKTVLNLGFNSTIEDRTGGDIKFIEGKGDNSNTYFEENKTKRFSSQLSVTHNFNDKSTLTVKNSLSYYDRGITTPLSHFSGIQHSSFSEVNYIHRNKNSEWIGGLNLWTDRFSENEIDSTIAVDYNHTTLGGFIQNTWSATKKFSLETGFRTDYLKEYGFFALPRFSMLLKVTDKFSARLGGGLGYKIPTVFTEDAERIQFRNVLPIDEIHTKAEKSTGGNFDLNYKTSLTSKLFITINTLFFYTQVNNPLILESLVDGTYEFIQPAGFIDTRGVETNIKLTYDNFKLFIGYTLADVNQHYNGSITKYPLVARHRLNNVLMYEIEDKLKIGLEAYYTGSQLLNDCAYGKSYWITGLMIEKLWENFSLFVNFENFSDTRQTKFDSIYTGTIQEPIFRDIYAPLEGFVINGGIKLKF